MLSVIFTDAVTFLRNLKIRLHSVICYSCAPSSHADHVCTTHQQNKNTCARPYPSQINPYDLREYSLVKGTPLDVFRFQRGHEREIRFDMNCFFMNTYLIVTKFCDNKLPLPPRAGYIISSRMRILISPNSLTF